MVGHLLGLPGVGRDDERNGPAQLALQRREQGLARVDPGQHLPHPVGDRHQCAPHLLGQRPQQRRHQLLAQAGHGERQRLPRRLLGDAVQDGDRDVDGHAVLGSAGREGVGQRQGERRGQSTAQLDGVRVVLGAHLTGRRGVGEHLGREGEQVRPLAPRLLPPAVEVPRRDDVGRDAGVVQLEQRLVVDGDVPPARPLLELGDPCDGALVVVPEAVVRRPLALDERVPDEQLAGDDGVDRAVLHAPARRPAGCRRASPAPWRRPIRAWRPSAAPSAAGSPGDRPAARRPPGRRGPRCGRTGGWSRRARRPRPSAAASSPAAYRERSRIGCRGRPGTRGRGDRASRPGSCAGSSCSPTWESRPAVTAAAMPRSSGSVAGPARFIPSRRTVPRSWPCRSCHSRMRR